MNLIIGATGQLGHALAIEHDRLKLPWHGTCREFSTSWPEAHAHRYSLVDLIEAQDTMQWFEAMHPSAVYYAAGLTAVDYCETHDAQARFLNYAMPAALAARCAARGIPFVYYSSDYVFGEHGGPHTEDATPAPINVYGDSKLRGERAVLKAHAGALVIRTTGVYGFEPAAKNFVAQLLTKLNDATVLNRLIQSDHEDFPVPMRVLVPFDQVSTPTYNADLAMASVKLVEGKQCGIWNVAGPRMVSRAEFARLVAMTFGLDPSHIIDVATRDLNQAARRPFTGGLDTSKLFAFLGQDLSNPTQGLQRMKQA